MHIAIVSLFNEMFAAISEYGITSRAINKGLVTLSFSDPRDFTSDRHRTVDDRPYGGGPGMLMKIQPLQDAINEARQEVGRDARVIYLSPQGRQLDQAMVAELASAQRLILLAGRYEGVDERLIDAEVDDEISIGDYVLSGGELPAMVLIDAITRQLPGALGHEDSAASDSFAEGLLDCQHYTRPEEYAGRRVPEVLLSGDHEKIRRWRLEQALGRTSERRPDLLTKKCLSAEEEELLADYRRKISCEATD